MFILRYVPVYSMEFSVQWIYSQDNLHYYLPPNADLLGLVGMVGTSGRTVALMPLAVVFIKWLLMDHCAHY